MKKKNGKSYPVQFGSKKKTWTVKQAAEFLGSNFGKSADSVTVTEDDKYLSCTVYNGYHHLEVRVIDGQWQWSFGYAYRKDGQAVVRDWHKAIRKIAGLFA